jgi:hypothetical protein
MSYNSDPSNSYESSDDESSAKNNDWKITRLTADQDNYDPYPDSRYNFDDLQGDDIQSINNPYDSETWYECTCGICYECINNYDEVERDDDDDEREDDEYYGEEEDQGYGEEEDQGYGEEEERDQDDGEQQEERDEGEAHDEEGDEYELGEGEDVCSCGNICLFEDALCVDCIEQNKYYTLVPRSGWTDVEYTDEGKDIIKNFPRYKERSSADILYLLSQEYCEFYYLYKNNSQAAAHQIQVALGRAFTGN